MPRVTQHTARKSKYQRTCTGCGKPVVEGDRYYHWTRRVGPKQGSFRHVACGPPRPTELTSRKTAQVDEAVADYAAPEVDLSVVRSWDTTDTDLPDTLELEAGVFEEAVAGVADTAEQVGEEYQDSVSNMPDSLQQGEQASMMEDVADRLREWAEELREKASESITVDVPPRGLDQTGDDWLAEVEQAVQDAWDERASELDDLMGDVPEYEG